MKFGNVEAKVAVPVVATALTGTLGAAAYRVLLAFGLFHPSAQQTISLAALGAALLVVVQGVTGYAAPHTNRADVISSYGKPVDDLGAYIADLEARRVMRNGSPRAMTPDPSPAPGLAPEFAPVSVPVEPQPPADAYPGTPPAAPDLSWVTTDRPIAPPAEPAPTGGSVQAPAVAPTAAEPTPAGSVQVPPVA